MKRILAIVVLLSAALHAQVSYDRLLRAATEPHNWLTYSGTFAGHRYSTLTQITPQNVRDLEPKWVFQARSLEKFEATPLVVDGIMYTVQPPNDIVAIDAATGRIFWVYSHRPSPLARLCCGRVNRGLAILGDTLFMGTIDGHLVAVDTKSGRLDLGCCAGAARGRLQPDAGSARRQGQGHRRAGGRRIRDSRVPGRVRCQDGKAGLALQHDSRTGRTRCAKPGAATPGRPAAARSG